MKNNKGFTLIELLVVMTIIAIITALSLASFDGARKSAKDGRRKADIEQIRSALEVYRSDCGLYPTATSNLLSSTVAQCLNNVYLSSVPADPNSTTTTSYPYLYSKISNNSYAICAHLELCDNCASVTCGGVSACGTGTCNYKQINP